MAMTHSEEGGASRKVLGGVLASITAALASVFLLFGDAPAAFISSSATVFCTEAAGITHMTGGTIAFFGKGITLISRGTNGQAAVQTVQHMQVMKQAQPSIKLSEETLLATTGKAKSALSHTFAKAVIASRTQESPERRV